MPLLYGIHDEEGLPILPKNGWSVALVSLSDGRGTAAFNTDYNWLVRMNWGYGTTGTIPERKDWPEYLSRLSTYIAHSSGITGIIIGNEPNLKAEWPNGQPILASEYAAFFQECRGLFKAARSKVQVITAAIGPYNLDSGSWVTYLRDVLNKTNPDGIAIHAYNRGSDPSLVSKDIIVPNGPLQGTQWGFRTYRDALNAVPSQHQNLPAYITEFDEYDPWENRNTGVVKAAYEEINNWNLLPGHSPKVHCLCLYRYPKYDQWFIEGKQGVITDFAEATQKGYKAPDDAFKVFIPEVGVVTPVDPSTPVESDPVDAESKARGVTIDELSGGLGWYAVKVDWLNEKESQGRHHILFDTLDEQGQRLANVNITVTWPSGFTKVTSQPKPGEPYSCDFPMSPSRNDFSCRVTEAIPSEVVRGIGMGADTPSGFNAGIHTSTVVVFQRLNIPQTDDKDAPSTQVQPGSRNVQIQWPIANPEKYLITQGFGENDIDYAKYGVKGHVGIDIAVPTGTDVLAAADGQVMEVGNMPNTYGNYVKLMHSWGESLYAHLMRQTVQQGMHVKAGERIGISNATGNATGPHLHFGIRVNPYNRTDGYDGYSDPLPYLHGSLFTDSLGILGSIKQAAQESGLDWRLLASLAWSESSFRPQIQDGLFQIGAATWSDWASKVGAVDINNPLDNARVAAAYLNWLLGHYNGDERKALTAYNFGPGNVDVGSNPPVATGFYVDKVIAGRDLLNAIGEK